VAVKVAEVQNMARHVLRNVLVLHAVAVRAALESAVQVGRGDEGNRQAEMANPTKCRDSLPFASFFSNAETGRTLSADEKRD
jgi:hypothetical protein